MQFSFADTINSIEGMRQRSCITRTQSAEDWGSNNPSRQKASFDRTEIYPLQETLDEQVKLLSLLYFEF
ncbi:MAG: hypothetical protein JXX14_08575 [Deltaproteobacteria bacterium]|nr:hypothetical protein [Deltaproteobacteria bacterium]